jgi:drug/metabolite transporter (DMT)-like permease
MSDGSGAAPAQRALSWPVLLALATVYLVWGSTYLGIKLALAGYPPFLMAGMRFLAAGLALYGWLRWRGVPAPTRAQWRTTAIMGALLLGGGNGLVCYAELTVSSGMAAIAVASMPLWAGLFGWWYGRAPSSREWLGLAIGFSGVVLLNLQGELRGSPAGAVALLLAPVAWAFGSMWSRGKPLPGPFMGTAAQMLCGGALMLGIGLLRGEDIAADPPWSATLALFYLAGFGSIAAFSAYVYLLDRVRPALATSYAYVNPPIAVLLGVLLAGEGLTALTVVAMAVILSGVVLITRARGR